jgi:hypothetical protein
MSSLAARKVRREGEEDYLRRAMRRVVGERRGRELRIMEWPRLVE